MRRRTGNGARASPDFVRMGRMSGNDRRMMAMRREEDEAEEVQQQHVFSRWLTNLEVVEFGEARAERHSPRKVRGAYTPAPSTLTLKLRSQGQDGTVPKSSEARAPLPAHSNICAAAS